MEDFITEIAKQLNTGGAEQTQYSVSEDGSTLIHGYPDEECALVFTKQDGQWVIQQKLIVSDAATNDAFGGSVSLSSDGNTALVGAPSKSSLTGAAYVFTRTGSTWTQQQTLTASDGAADDFFGWSVFISSDESVIKILNIHNKEYQFAVVDGTWVETSKLKKGN